MERDCLGGISTLEVHRKSFGIDYFRDLCSLLYVFRRRKLPCRADTSVVTKGLLQCGLERAIVV
jgi:hypothetical protein